MNNYPTISQYDKLMNLAYSSAFDERPWRSFLDYFCEIIKARDASIVIQNFPSNEKGRVDLRYLLVTSNSSDYLTREFLDGVMAADIIMEIEQPRALELSEILPDTYQETRLYKDYLAPQGIRYLLSIDIFRTENLCMKFSVERDEGESAFKDSDKELLELMVPHLRRALQLQSKVGDGHQMKTFYEQILDKMEVGCVLLDSDGLFVSANDSAQKIIQLGTLIKKSGGQLVLSGRAASRKFREAVKLAVVASQQRITSQSGVCIGVDGCGLAPSMELVVKPFHGDWFSSVEKSPAAAVFIHVNRVSDQPVDSRALSDVYGFTKKEATLAALLGSGHSIGEVADQMSISVNTAKTHLRGVYEKTGLNRQSQIVGLLSTSTVKLL